MMKESRVGGVAPKKARAVRLGWMLGLALLFTVTSAQAQTTYYVGNAVAGDESCLTSAANNCLFATAAALVSAGDTITMADGVYTGANSMIDPPTNLNGSAGSPITVVATNDGEVRINGEGARRPINLEGNDWWVIDGVDAHNSSGDVVSIQPSGANDSDNNVIRNVCAWDAESTGNYNVWLVYGATNTLLEDVCGFGTGRKIFLDFEAQNTTIRRAWGRFQGTTNNSGPYVTYSLAYSSNGGICENCIAAWDESASLGSDPSGIYALFSRDGAYQQAVTNHKLLGSIAYKLAGETHTKNPRLVWMIQNHKTANLTDVIAYHEAGATSVIPFTLAPFTFSEMTASNQTATDITSIRGSADDKDAEWTVTDHEDLAGDTADWFDDGTGADICFQTVDGVETTAELWPWPMDARISAALTDASYDAVDAHATSTTGLLTDLIVELAGEAIPDGCDSTFTPPPAGTITVTLPSAGQVIQRDGITTANINWVPDNVTGNVDIMEATSNDRVIATVDVDSAPYVWTIDVGTKTTHQIKVCDSATGTICGTGPAFTVLGEYAF